MVERIFRSILSLIFHNSEIETAYEKNMNKYMKKYFFIFCISFLIGSIITAAINFSFRDSTDTVEFLIVKSVSYINVLINAICLGINFLTKKIKIKRWLLYTGYVFFIFTCANFKYPLIVFVYNKTFILMIILLLIEILFRLLFGVLYLFSFREYVVLNLIEIGLIWIYIYPTSDPLVTRVSLFYLFCYNFLFSFFTFFCYFVEKQLKTSFFYQFKFEQNLRWLNILLDNVNTGILSLEGKKIKQYNKSLMKIIPKINYEQNVDNECKLL
jgi:hypothetical protein